MQAYHTSCRHGLAGHSGFQFNAATPGIDANMLTQLAMTHAGYHPPRDLPREPAAEELAAFPIALKFLPVDGTPVISQTVYVGREFRGRDGEPDSGRFGNYFSHVIIADTAASEPFDGLLPIELWKAGHWKTEESSGAELDAIETLSPGHVDLDWALERLPDPSLGWHALLLDAVLGAIEGGPRVVLLEPDNERAAAWIAWVTYALPNDLARRLSFATFTGQPRYAQDIQLCVTTRGCDLSFAEHEIGHDVLLLDPAADAPPARLLYARVASALAQEGSDALASSIVVASGGDAQRRGAQLALRTGMIALASEEHVPSILEVLLELARAGEWATVDRGGRQLPADSATEAIVRGWWSLHTAGREATAEAARSLVDQALTRLLAPGIALPDDLSKVSSDCPTTPSPSLLAAWLDRVEATADVHERVSLIDLGVRLGLVGCNVALDRRVANAIVDLIDSAEMRDALVRLASGQTHELVEGVLRSLASDAMADTRALSRLRGVLIDPELEAMMSRLAIDTEDLDERVIWESLLVEVEPSRLPRAIATLIPMAQRSQRIERVSRVFGPNGPTSIEHHELLLSALVRAGVAGSERAIQDGLLALSRVPLTEDARGCRLFDLIDTMTPDGELRQDPVFAAWTAACYQTRTTFAQWADWVAVACAGPAASLPRDRFTELWQLAGIAAVERLATDVDDDTLRADVDPHSEDPWSDYSEGMRILSDAFGADWPRTVALAMCDMLAHGSDPAWFGAAAFLWWSALPAGTGDLIESALPVALETQSARRIRAIADMLEECDREEFERWYERHQPDAAGVGGAVSRLLRRAGEHQ